MQNFITRATPSGRKVIGEERKLLKVEVSSGPLSRQNSLEEVEDCDGLETAFKAIQQNARKTDEGVTKERMLLKLIFLQNLKTLVFPGGSSLIQNPRIRMNSWLFVG